MLLFYLPLLHLTLSQDLHVPYILSDCTHLILPPRCQCYHSGYESQLHCHNIQLDSLPKLPNNMRWYALDFSSNDITTIESYIFSDIYVEKLNLRWNLLQTIDLTAFDQIQHLKQLLIDHNQLNEFNPNILTSPGVSLEILDLSYNPLGYLDLGEIFLQSPYLKEFSVVSCQLNNSSLYTLLKLSGQHNQYIQIIDLSYNHLSTLCSPLFDSFTSLIELRLNINHIHSIDNYIIHSLNYLQTLNLAFNSIEHLPHLSSLSLEYLNLSSNHIRHLNDYFASDLYSIRMIDFDSNKYLHSISPRAFCSINILTLRKLSFLHNDLVSIDAFSEFLCRLLDHNTSQSMIDVNHNVNLECSCILILFEKYLIDYLDLTCTQQGQDRYFISNVRNSFSNCSLDFCMKQKKENICEWHHAEQASLAGGCQTMMIQNENMTKNESEVMTTMNDSRLWENATVFQESRQTSLARLTIHVNYIWIGSLVFVLYI